jgi:biotin operon repressor
LGVEFGVVEAREPFPYQRIARKAARLEELGMSAASIAEALGVSDKTVTKAIGWLRRQRQEQ